VPALSPDPSFGDAAEAQTVPYILGIAHPTGFPAFTLAGWLFSHVVAVGTVAWRMNLFAALCVACSAAGVVVLASLLECNALAALFAALAFVFGSIACQEAVLANVHVLAVLAGVLALAFSVKFARDGDRRALFGACACAGLGLATHPFVAFVVPGIVVAVAWQARTTARSTYAIAAAALLVPLSLYAYLPLRSSVVAAAGLDPTAGAPLYGAGSFDWDTNHPRTPQGFLDEVLARREHAGGALKYAFNAQSIPATLAFWSVEWSRQFGAWFALFAAGGLAALVQRDRRGLSVLAAGTLGMFAFAHAFRADAELGGYLLLPLAVLAVLAAAGSRLVLPRVPRAAVSAAATIGLGVLAVVAWSSPRDFGLGPATGQAAIDEIAGYVPDGAIVVAEWGEAAALGYGASVERALGSRTIVAAWPAEFAGRYPYWAQFRTVVIYVDALGISELHYISPAWLGQLRSPPRSPLLFEIVPPAQVRLRQNG